MANLNLTAKPVFNGTVRYLRLTDRTPPAGGGVAACDFGMIVRGRDSKFYVLADKSVLIGTTPDGIQQWKRERIDTQGYPTEKRALEAARKARRVQLGL
jgi:phage terminase large subunit-like protein